MSVVSHSFARHGSAFPSSVIFTKGSYIILAISCTCLFIVFGSYMTLTLLPLKNFIFKDPLTNKYGYTAHSEQFSIMKKNK